MVAYGGNALNNSIIDESSSTEVAETDFQQQTVMANTGRSNSELSRHIRIMSHAKHYAAAPRDFPRQQPFFIRHAQPIYRIYR